MAAPLHLFDGFGIELEYAIVDRDTLDVRPIADRLLEAAAGKPTMEVERGKMAWSNELALHVLEFKVNGPASHLEGLAARFDEEIGEANRLLSRWGARLLPTAMHPWMHPDTELRLWPQDDDLIYGTFDRIFGCRGHGWANLQSAHLNLPFAGDAEFASLHAAIRLVLPLLPALAASSPVMEGQRSEFLDARLEAYRHNARLVPSVTGRVIPERVFTRESYERELLEPIYDDLRSLDPEGILRYEWVNARGCIARFDRMALEIRVLDTQECPRADISVAALTTAVVRWLVELRGPPLEEQARWDEVALEAILLATIRDGERAVISNRPYLALWGYPGDSCSAADLWKHLFERVLTTEARSDWAPFLDVWETHGPLSRRILDSVSGDCSRARLTDVYRRLADCLAKGEVFLP